MVMPTMAWLSGASSKSSSHNHTRSLFGHSNYKSSSSSVTLGILSFETAKTMARIIFLYKSLSNNEFSNLREGAMKSEGVAFLNSNDEKYLLGLACAEKLEDLNRAATTVSRLVQKCNDTALKLFDRSYAEMSLGIMDLGKLEYGSRNIEKLVEKMEKYVKATSNLHTALSCLSEMELSEKKFKQMKRTFGPKQPNMDYFNEKLANQRKLVKHYRDISLWSQTFDQAVSLMARIVSIIYARIVVVFAPFVPDLPRPRKIVKPQKITRMRVHPEADFCLLRARDKYRQCASKSGPIQKPSRKVSTVRVAKSGPLMKSQETGIYNRVPLEIGKRKRVMHLPTESMVGGAGLALRYANILILAESYLHAPTNIDDEARGLLYELLPDNLKMTVRRKLWNHWCTRRGEGNDCNSLAEGWREALEEMLGWLGPVAHDTMKWQQERYLEKQRFDVKPTVMLFQTLYFSDLEKTEAAIVEVLVGLSYIYRYENKRVGGQRPDGVGYR